MSKITIDIREFERRMEKEDELRLKFDTVEFPDGKGYQRHGSPTFYSMLEQMADLHDKKSHDYASNSDPFGNYRFAGLVAGMFSHSPDDAGFAGRLAEKLYRLSVLEGGRKTPKNESIDDTELDIAVITLLWMSARRDIRRKKLLEQTRQDMKKGMDTLAQSEATVCAMIDLEKHLTSRDRQQMIDYLKACQRDDNVTEGNSSPKDQKV